MIVAEKLYQKFSNYTSKGYIKKFFLYLTEKTLIRIKVKNGSISSSSNYADKFLGHYYIEWGQNKFSTGNVSSFVLNNFEEFLNNARINAFEKENTAIKVPKRKIYPMVQTFCKQVSDFISIPEYFLKVADNLASLQQTLKHTNCEIELKLESGQKFTYSSDELDEQFPYTLFSLYIKIDSKIICYIKTANLIPLDQFDFISTYYGDLIVEYDKYIGNKKQFTKSKSNIIKDDSLIIINPIVFEKLLDIQLKQQLNAQNILDGLSSFSKEDILVKKKLFEDLTISYDSSSKNKAGSYKFGKHAESPGNIHIFKNGTILSLIVDLLNHKDVDINAPEFSFLHYSNLLFPKLNYKRIEEIYNSKNFYQIFSINQQKESIYKYKTNEIMFKDHSGKFVVEYIPLDLEINILDILDKHKPTIIKYNEHELGLLVEYRYLH